MAEGIMLRAKSLRTCSSETSKWFLTSTLKQARLLDYTRDAVTKYVFASKAKPYVASKPAPMKYYQVAGARARCNSKRLSPSPP